MKFQIIIIFSICFASCNRDERIRENIALDSLSSIKNQDTIKVNHQFTNQDSVELTAIKGFYFGKMHSDKQVSEKLEIAEIKFSGTSYDGYSWNFFHSIDDKEINYQSMIEDLVRVVNFKYGNPRIINIKKTWYNSFYNNYPSKKATMTDKYMWQTKYKNIFVGTIEYYGEIQYITFRIVNLKLKKEYDLNAIKEKNKNIRKEAEKI